MLFENDLKKKHSQINIDKLIYGYKQIKNKKHEVFSTSSKIH